MKSIKLNNGLSVLYYPMMNTHSVTLGLYLKAGIAYEAKKDAGITHFLEHLHFRRIGNIPQKDMYYEMESIGTGLRCVTYADFLQFTMKVVPEKVSECMAIFKNILCKTEWTIEEFQKEKGIVLNHIKERDNFVYIEDEIRKTVFKKTSLSERIIGNYGSIEQLSQEDLQKFRNSIFNKNNMFFCITGHVGESELSELIKQLDDLEIADGDIKHWMSVPEVFHHRGPDIVFKTTADEILDVNISFDVSGDHYQNNAIRMVNCILGEGIGSKLQKNIREEKAYTFDVYSYLEEYKNFAVLHIRFSVERKLLMACFEEVMRVINEIKSQISEEDVEVSLPFYTANKVFLEDDTEKMNLEIAYDEFVRGKEQIDCNLTYNEELLGNLHRVATKIFVPENACVVMVGNTKGITKKTLKTMLNKLQ